MRREPEAVEALLAELEPPFRRQAEAALAGADEGGARLLVERLATALQATLLVRHAPAAVADAYLARAGSAYGTLPPGGDFASIIERHRPITGLTTA
jgi:putative acyl-CoA dehydrogenase